MPNLKKIILIFLLVAFLVLLSASFSLAQEEGKPLEVGYPEVGGWRPETIQQAVLPQYIKYIFTFSIAIAGLVAFGALIYGGFRYITSAGAPTAQTEAKDQIFAGLIGLVILLSSYLILTTVNPQLVLLKAPKVLTIKTTEIPGVYLSTEASFPSDEEIKAGKKVYQLSSSVGDLSALVNGEVKSLKIVNQYVIEKEGEILTERLPFSYGVFLHTEKNWEGDCSHFRSVGSSESFKELKITPASITVFREVEKEKGNGVFLYTGESRGGEKSERLSVTTGENDLFQKLPEGFGENVWSIEMNGDYLLVLGGSNKFGTPMYAAFDGSVSSLKGLLINSCVGFHSEEDFWWYDKSCAHTYALLPTY